MKSALVLFVFCCSALAATVPVVSVSSPANNSTDNSPVHYVASASSPQCAQGIAAIRIYTAPKVSPYTVNGAALDTEVNLPAGTYNTVVQAWDNCGGVGTTAVTITVKAGNLTPAKFVYSSDLGSGKVTGYLVNSASGALAPTGQTPVWAHWGPVRMASDKGGYRLYVANQGSHDVNAYFIYRNNGYLVAAPGSPFAVAGTGTNLAVHPSGKYVYVTTDSSHGGESSVTALAVNSDGSLAPIAGSPFGIADSPESIAIDPQGKYLYVGHANSADIDGYAINPVNGALTPVPGEPFTVPISDACFLCDTGGIYDLAIDASGTYLLAPVLFYGEVGVYRIDPATGSLAAVPTSPYLDNLPDSPTAPGSETESIAIDPQNNFVYLDDNDCGGDGTCAHAALSVLRLDAASGALLRMPGHFNDSGICNEDSVRTDPSGSFLYVGSVTPCGGDSQPASIMGFAINPSSGSLTTVGGSPFPQNVSAPPNRFPQWNSVVVTP